MDIEKAELQLKEMAHSEQHYFNRYVLPSHARCFEQKDQLLTLHVDSYNHHGMHRKANQMNRILRVQC